MKGDFSRRTFDAAKHYSGVLVEQGRMLTDADSEEEHRILSHREQRAVQDIVGDCGGPLPDAGFGLSTPDNVELRIGAGPYYIAGILVENEAATAYPDQPDRVDVPWPLPAGRHAIVLETWPRLITALDDPSIREVALGGPTTSARERVVWQVGAISVPDDWTCTDDLPNAGATTGELAARAEPDEVVTSPCLVPPQAGYTGLENQFYRVEIFDSGTAYDLVEAADTVDVTGFPAGTTNQVTVSAVGPLVVGDGVEIFRTSADPDPLAATFGHVTAVDGTTLTLSTSVPAFTPAEAPRLRRVEASFVVSRDNGSVATTIEAIDGVEVTVHDTGVDDVLGFAIGQLVEISDDRIELDGARRRLHQIADIDQARKVIILRTPAAALDGADPSGVDPTRHAKLRRWDGAGAARFRPDGTGWIHLEAGNEVRFTDGRYRSGDYWTFPARAATVDDASGTIGWPDDSGTPALRLPFGIVRRRCVLGYVDIDGTGGITDVEDCRNLFPPLTSMRNLLHVGGDGQEGSSTDAVGGFIPLPGRLAVRVANGGFPVEGATVQFSVELGGGRLEGGGPRIPVDTDPDGLATVSWDLDNTPHQLCVAQLLAPSGDVIPHQVVRFHATVDRDQDDRRDCCWSVGPGGDYPTLDEALVDLIVRRGERDICVCLIPGDHPFSGGSSDVDAETVPMRLSIHGSGRGTRVLVEGRWLLSGWRAVSLRDLDLLMNRDAFLAFTDVAEVELSGLHIVGVRPDGALVSVQDFRRLAVVSSVLVARAPRTFAIVQRVLDGLGGLTRPWNLPDEVVLRPAIEETASELVNLPAADRRELARQLQERLELPLDELSRGERFALNQLVDALGPGPSWSACAQALDAVARAAGSARGGVALELGPAPTGQVGAGPSPQVSVLISDNDLVGVLTCYGRGEPQFVLDEQTVRILDDLVRDTVQLTGAGGDVHIRDNRLSRLALSIEMIGALNRLAQNPQQPFRAGYESFHLTDNVIDGPVSEIFARHTAVTANDFTLDALPANQPPPNGVVANVIADTATYTGNHGQIPVAGAAPATIRDITRTSAEAANLELQIL